MIALVLLACPVGMGLMMWFMMRGNRSHESPPKTMSSAELRAEHERLGAELDRAVAREEVRRPTPSEPSLAEVTPLPAQQGSALRKAHRTPRRTDQRRTA